MTADHIAGIDHVSLPLHDTAAMVVFYRSLGFDVAEQKAIVSVYAGEQMINFHRPEVWPRAGFTLRAPAAIPPCGDLCFVWNGDEDMLRTRLKEVGAEIEEGPVERVGARKQAATSVYVRDPDGNLLEFMIYGDSTAASVDRPGSTTV
ncbi:MAG TPA: VOC family protein [Acidimicrobiia bacterium]|nr:VOC family protein [Acidimicrobiia bacterium]